MKTERAKFASEADLCAAFLAAVPDRKEWTAYAETAGFDILLVRRSDGVQIGIEAKLVLNAKVLSQALPNGLSYTYGERGPEFRAILVPDGVGYDLIRICGALGVTVIRQKAEKHAYADWFYPSLPDIRWERDDWHEWMPVHRCFVPDYVPDVAAGASAPVALTPWKVKAIKLAIILEERPVSRADFKALGLSPSRWTDPYAGWLVATPKGFVAGKRLPDFRAQHPRNYEEIRSDRAKWEPQRSAVQGSLLQARSPRSTRAGEAA